MKCFGISVGCILNFLFVHSVYRAVMVFLVFLIRCVSTFVHDTTDMGVVYIDYHSLIVVFGISDWMCHFSIGHSMSIIWLTSQMRIVSTLSLFGVLVFLICCVLNFVLIPQTWPI